MTDKQGLAVSGAEVHVAGTSAAVRPQRDNRRARADIRFPALPAGTYKMTVTRDGFRTESFNDLEVTLNRTLNFDVQLQVGSTQERVEVSAEIPLLEPDLVATEHHHRSAGNRDMPINGRNYLDFMQLVPGVAINRQADAE